ncbi:MAG: DUF3179 domain-containing protein [Cellvibrionaceae bacterium]
MLLTIGGLPQALAEKRTPEEIASTKIELATSKHFLQLIIGDDLDAIDNALSYIQSKWNRAFIPFAIETYNYTRSPAVRQELKRLIINEAGSQNFSSLNDLYRWLWNQDIEPAADYANFKGELYQSIDDRFEKYFRNRQDSARIRLDEIRWGGVLQDGIPPLRNPKMLKANKASYLDDRDIIFGIKINGDARAYPKRILAWHEMFTDTIGGIDIAGVYCTLCGTVIPYRTSVNGVKYTLGTSGFLYRSNKLMYDKATQSLWSTERGEPVLGPLVDKGITLPYESVVTTTWGEWRKRNPNTTVLSLKTGHRRNYNEGVAYQDYFATDELMFNTPFDDQRLENKQEILALRFAASPKEQLAIDTDYLKKNPIYRNNIGQQQFIVFTDKTGANRVYDPETIQFVSYDGEEKAKDDKGNIWIVGEEELSNTSGKKLARLPYHRAFWFGWHAAFPETKLIK